jgi:hypothetical protein
MRIDVTAYLRLFVGGCGEVLKGSLTPSWPHPKGNRRGFYREGRETPVYLGKVFLIWTPRGVA